jgi:hypothetical protein
MLFSKSTTTPLTLPSGEECRTNNYRIQAEKSEEIIIPRCIFTIVETNQGILDLNLGNLK